MESSRARRVPHDQMMVLMDFMGQHVELAQGELRCNIARTRNKSKLLWAELARTVNNAGVVKKTPDMWSRYWSDYKNKLKNKLIERSKQAKRSEAVKPLSKLEKRALIILGSKFSRVGTKKPADWNSPFKKLITVKVENLQEHDNGESCKEASEGSDRISEGDKDMDGEESSFEENAEEAEQDNSEMSLQNIYPKWLIEVETKRAEAELTRAKAEEQRAITSAKAAEAALIQAEALKKLSDAAAVQAEALMRIAVSLENRNHQELKPV